MPLSRKVIMPRPDRESHKERNASGMYNGHSRACTRTEERKWVVANYLRKAEYKTSHLLPTAKHCSRHSISLSQRILASGTGDLLAPVKPRMALAGAFWLTNLVLSQPRKKLFCLQSSCRASLSTPLSQHIHLRSYLFHQSCWVLRSKERVGRSVTV